MNRQIENIRRTRQYILDSVKDLSLEKLNKVPQGFNNNIFWNLGHLVAAQQSICYIKGGLEAPLEENLYASYKPGTRPNRFFDISEEDEMKSLLISSVDQLQDHYRNNYFVTFSPWTNRYGNTLSDIDEAIMYLQFHEGLHLGVISSIRKLVQKQGPQIV